MRKKKRKWTIFTILNVKLNVKLRVLYRKRFDPLTFHLKSSRHFKVKIQKNLTLKNFYHVRSSNELTMGKVDYNFNFDIETECKT